MPKKRVVLVANTAWYLLNFRTNTIQQLLREGFQVYCIVPDSSHVQELVSLGVTVKTFNLDNSSTNLIKEAISLIELAFLIKGIDAFLVYSFNPKTNIYSLLSCGLLGVACVPNVSGVGTASTLKGWKGFIYNKLLRISFRSATHIFFQNKDDMSSFSELGLLHGKSNECLPGSGVDLQRFQPSVVKESGSRAFLMASRLIEQKGVLDFLKAARSILDEGFEARFYLAGIVDRSNRGVSEESIRSLLIPEKIVFLGEIRDMALVMNNIDCVILPSRYPEGVPRFLLEGLASGKVLITTDAAGCRDTVSDRENGFLIEPGSLQSLKDAIRKTLVLSEETFLKMKTCSRSLAEKKYDENIVLKRYVQIASEISTRNSISVNE